MEFNEFETALLDVLEKHKQEGKDINKDFLAPMLSALLFSIPDNRMLLFQLIEKLLENIEDDGSRRFLNEFMDLLGKLRESQGH